LFDYYTKVGVSSIINEFESGIEINLYGKMAMTVPHEYLDVEVDANHIVIQHLKIIQERMLD